jgi:hypothetical protein
MTMKKMMLAIFIWSVIMIGIMEYTIYEHEMTHYQVATHYWGYNATMVVDYLTFSGYVNITTEQPFKNEQQRLVYYQEAIELDNMTYLYGSFLLLVWGVGIFTIAYHKSHWDKEHTDIDIDEKVVSR